MLKLLTDKRNINDDRPFVAVVDCKNRQSTVIGLCCNSTGMERLLKAVKPLFYVSRIVGLAPYSLSGNGKLAVYLPTLVYSILINVITISMPVYCLLRFGTYDYVRHMSVPDLGIIILNTVTLFTSALSASLTLFRCRNFIHIYSEVLYLCSVFEDEPSVSHKCLTAIMELIILACIPFFILYNLFCATLNSPTISLFLMPVNFLVVFCPLVVVLQFASLVFISMRVLSYINTRLSKILTEVSFPSRDRLLTLPALSSGFPSAKPQHRRRSSFEIMSSKCPARRNRVSGMSTFSSQVFCVSPKVVTSRINKDSTRLLSPGFTLHLRLQILSLIDFHDGLCDTVRSINSAYSVRILTNVADIFIGITVSLFCSYFIPTHSNHVKTIYIFILVVYFDLARLLILLYACTACTEEVSSLRSR
jgi:hypothetical protein